MLEGEYILNGIILRIYNKNTPKVLEGDNMKFLKVLFSQLKEKFNETVILNLYIKNNGQIEENLH